MKREAVIKQLEKIRDYSIAALSFCNKDFLKKDIDALEYAINLIKKQEPKIYKFELEANTFINIKADNLEEAEEKATEVWEENFGGLFGGVNLISEEEGVRR